jgi:hypothetical protein
MGELIFGWRGPVAALTVASRKLGLSTGQHFDNATRRVAGGSDFLQHLLSFHVIFGLCDKVFSEQVF